jgi:membrane protein implicated in regulation of membrane protease activity
VEPDPPASASQGSPGGLALAITLYVGARVLLVAVIAGVLVLVGLPLLLALIVALVVALPLSLVLFRSLRTRLNREIDVATAGRRAQKERLRAELRGDAPPSE